MGRGLRHALFVVFTTALLCMMLGGTGRAANDECFAKQLKGARVTASVRFKHDGEDYSKAEGRLTVKVPKSWARAEDLLLNGDTERYRTAMRCLLRYPDDPFPYRDTEGRTRAPRVTVEQKWITVRQEVTTWVVSLQDRDFGPWRISPGNRLWTLELMRPPALNGAWWQEVSVDLGGRAGRSLASVPTSGSSAKLTWTKEKAGNKPPEVRMTLQPPATKASAARWSEDPWYVFEKMAWLTYDVTLLALFLAVVRVMGRAPVTSPSSDAERRTVRKLLVTVSLAFAITLVNAFDDTMLPHLANDGTALFWTDRHRIAVHLVLTLLTGVLLCVFGRPGHTAVLLVVAASGYVLAVVCRPQWFALPAELWLDWENDPAGVRSFRDNGGMPAFAGACACLVLVWLVGATSFLLRLWRSSHAPAPGSSTGRFPHTALGAFVLVSVALPATNVWTAQRLWEHQSWLSRRNAYEEYGLWHVASLFDTVRWFPADWLSWIHGHFWWWGPSLALLAVLRARDTAAARPAALPSRPEELALKTFFVIAVGPVIGWYAGVPLPLLPLLALWLTLTALLAFGARRSVLHRELLPGLRLHEVTDRRRQLRAARRHRELHAQLRRLDQGQMDGEREKLERELDRLHRLPHPSSPPGGLRSWVRLPPSIGPVELALAWGPRDSWWDNGCRAARFAGLIAIPAVGFLTWAEHIRGILWDDKFMQRFGFADILGSLMTMEVIWASAGFTLGALWRVLPGRRGPARAFWLSLVYAAPVLVHWIGTRVVDQSFTTWALNLGLTLFVLTLTGVAMDIDTFRREGHYWPNKAGLLLSVYQWRTASLQVAFLVGQIVALVTIWQQLKGNEPMVLIERSPSEAAGGESSGDVP